MIKKEVINMMMNKGQTALEYLLIIAGAIAIAAIAVYIAMSSMQSSGATVGNQAEMLSGCQKVCINPTCKLVEDCVGQCMSVCEDANAVSNYSCTKGDTLIASCT
ncbi:MAG: class III signal peptide-containing protein [Candidatus Diapherotrites archaeon]|nr:class III signal peptide-containing protein [Candidatus Diapherotrites archaeon]